MLKRFSHLPSLVLAALVAAPACSAAAPAQFGRHFPFTTEQLPPGGLRSALERLPAATRGRALQWLHTFDFPAADARATLRVDRHGAALYVDEAPQLPGGSLPVADGGSGAATPISSADAFRLHSRPGATKVLYLDFDGHIVSGTAWNAASGIASYDALPYDTDGVADTYSDAERQSIIGIWRRVAEDYVPFDVDVTTELPASFGPTTGRALITRDSDRNGVAMPYQGAGGVAYIGVFGDVNYGYYSPALVYFNRLGAGREDYVAEATSHEFGHNMGLSHDGTASVTYYAGHGSGATSWAPIMGNSYGKSVSQWSSGEYSGANNTQDDVALIRGRLADRGDDHGDSAATASVLVAASDGTVTSTKVDQDILNAQPENKGIIGSRTDVDVFLLDAGDGTLSLSITPHRMPSNTLGGNLDLQAELYAEGGALVAKSAPDGDTRAQLTASVAAGRYFLHVGGAGDATVPYSDYGSMGRYFIDGSIPLAAADTVPPSPNPMVFEIAPYATSANSIAMRAMTALDAGGAAVQYRFDCVSGGVGCAAGAWQTGRDYTATGLAAGTTYGFQVTARDAYGNATAASANFSATTPAANRAPLPVADLATVAKRGSVTLAVLANDSDPDGDPLQVVAVSRPAKGTVTFTPTSVTYVNGGRTGSDSFNYTVSDGRGGTASAQVKITIK